MTAQPARVSSSRGGMEAYSRSLPPLGPDPNTPTCLSPASGPTASRMRLLVAAPPPCRWDPSPSTPTSTLLRRGKSNGAGMYTPRAGRLAIVGAWRVRLTKMGIFATSGQADGARRGVPCDGDGGSADGAEEARAKMGCTALAPKTTPVLSRRLGDGVGRAEGEGASSPRVCARSEGRRVPASLPPRSTGGESNGFTKSIGPSGQQTSRRSRKGRGNLIVHHFTVPTTAILEPAPHALRRTLALDSTGSQPRFN